LKVLKATKKNRDLGPRQHPNTKASPFDIYLFRRLDLAMGFRLLLIAVLCFLLTLAAPSNGFGDSINWVTLAEAKDLAAEQGKPSAWVTSMATLLLALT
jgi:hypothetical protein